MASTCSKQQKVVISKFNVGGLRTSGRCFTNTSCPYATRSGYVAEQPTNRNCVSSVTPSGIPSNNHKKLQSSYKKEMESDKE